MRVVVTNLYSERRWEVSGTPAQIEAALLLRFPWLRSTNPEDRGDLDALLEHLASAQAFIVEILKGE